MISVGEDFEGSVVVYTTQCSTILGTREWLGRFFYFYIILTKKPINKIMKLKFLKSRNII